MATNDPIARSVAAGAGRDERAFGSAAGTSLAAKFDLSSVLAHCSCS